jgi:AcrR family transcriptional regulator
MDKSEEIIRVASKMFYEKGFDKTTMRDLSKATGLTTAGLYYHIRSKKVLLIKVNELLINEFEKKVFLTLKWERDPKKRMRQYIQNVVGSVLDAPEMHSIMMERAIFRGEIKKVSRPKRKELVNKTKEFLIKIRKDGNAARDIDEYIDITVAAFSLIAIVNWIPFWFNPKGRINERQLIDSLSKFFIKFFLKEEKKNTSRMGN